MGSLGRPGVAITSVRQRCFSLPLLLQTSLLLLPEDYSKLVVRSLGSEPQSGCPRPAASSVSPLDHRDSAGFSLYLSLDICSSAFFLVFLFNLFQMDYKNFFLCLSLLLSSFIFSQIILIIFYC